MSIRKSSFPLYNPFIPPWWSLPNTESDASKSIFHFLILLYNY
ncbi:hypothetical protein X975_19941, partial [Stegodyphus mimosarum]